MDIHADLNPSQQEAVKTVDGPLLILAGAGSGKTRVLVYRIAHMTELGVRPFNILAITFTNKAAREMKERVGKLVACPDDVWVSTFHSMCVRILRREIDKIGYDSKFTIYDMDDCQRVMKQVFKELNINEKLLSVKAVISAISKKKDALIGPREYAETAGDFRERQIAGLYEAYQRRLRANNALDFDDLIFKTVELFAQRPEVLEKYQNRFRYIHVDEYQDTNHSQYTLVKMLSVKYQNICVVGDDDQSIYGWRGADISNILNFEKDFPGAKVIRLERNYRSTNTILKAANDVIRNNSRRKGKELWTEKGGGEPIACHTAASHLEEAAFVIDDIKKRAAKGAAYKDFAILYRMNMLSRPFEERLVKDNVPYRVYGGVRFYERMEIKDVLAYLKSVYNPLDDMSVKRIINVPRRGIGDETVSMLENYAADMEVPFYDAVASAAEIPGLPYNGKRVTDFSRLLQQLRGIAENGMVTDVLNEVFERTGYLDALLVSDSDKEAAKDRVANVMELMAKAQEFVKQAADTGTDPSTAAFLEEVALVADIDSLSQEQDQVALMTMHSAKGLEFNHVYIVGFEEGVFPGNRAAFSSDTSEMEEERRVCYVAITRARESLCITGAVWRKMFNETVYNSPSRFLKEIPKELTEIVKNDAKTQKKGAEWKKIAMVAPAPKQKTEIVLPKPSKVEPPDFLTGDFVNQKKYGRGKVTGIKPAGADYEVSVDFPGVGVKKFYAYLSNLERTE